MQPYEIRLKDGQLPAVVIYAPSIEAQPRAWRTRLRWAWRCLRGQSLDLNPTVMLMGNNIRSQGTTPAIEIKTPSEGATSLFPERE